MASFNRVILLGNLTRDVEIRHLPSGSVVGEVGLAVNDRRKTATGEWVDETSFFDITLWGRTAEVAAQYLSKGSPMLCEGRLKQETWEKGWAKAIQSEGYLRENADGRGSSGWWWRKFCPIQ